jgi:methylated-DNA-[protein]-cysteine S-methyltransferase
MNTEHVFDALIESPVGTLGINITDNCLSGIEFLGKLETRTEQSGQSNASIKQVRAALKEYFAAADSIVNIKIDLQGTDYQQRVWAALRSIPAGQTCTYGDVARQIGSSPRAVGNACRRNPVPIFVPCHRVVSANGSGGFMGSTSGQPLVIKHWLLEHERTH